ncbi:MAG: peptide chain release factor 3 [Puniceicoccaceae bacterium]|nr:MAG: peptide chain release factor 3 [Puniceicoccaceae bacterium]
MTKQLHHECARRRTFAIISHPDAGKTTLTEKLLLYGGAKEQAGGVRSRKNAQDTSSDWLELEKQRGISVSSAVMRFEYEDFCVNILDTPGHRDFSEDTYRVLMAVDSAIMVLDAAKGIEDQTLKLFEVCRKRGIPIITFINKCDRPGKEPLELLDEIETRLGLKTFAVNLPIGDGPDFVGLLDRAGGALHRFERVSGGRFRAAVSISGLDDPALREAVPKAILDQLTETDQLLEAAGSQLDTQAIAQGQLTPVFFGSAINNFGVQLLLDGLLAHSAPPQARAAGDTRIEPTEAVFSAFVFKIQANMDPNHRDRLAFLRICSGCFHRDLRVRLARTGKILRLSHTHQVFGRERETGDEAWPGDILGVTGQADLEIGDTLTESKTICYDAIPRFAPECFVYLHSTDTQTHKRFTKGLEQLLQEKVIQRFYPLHADQRIPLIGAVGQLQFDVVRYRLEAEYGADSRMETAPWTITRWIDPADADHPALKGYLSGATRVKDDLDRPCLLFETQWNLDYFTREHGEVRLYNTPPEAGSSTE